MNTQQKQIEKLEAKGYSFLENGEFGIIRLHKENKIIAVQPGGFTVGYSK